MKDLKFTESMKMERMHQKYIEIVVHHPFGNTLYMRAQPGWSMKQLKEFIMIQIDQEEHKDNFALSLAQK